MCGGPGTHPLDPLRISHQGPDVGQQRSAVEHGLVDGKLPSIPGPLLLIAGAGSGKTLTLASRVARLVLAGADPQRLLLLTFSRRAARTHRSAIEPL